MPEISETEVRSYRVLGVQPGASLDEVRRAFRKQAMLNHPDRNPGDAAADKRFREILEAYRITTHHIKWQAGRPAPEGEPADDADIQIQRAFAQRRWKRRKTDAFRFFHRNLLFIAFIVGPTLFILGVIWATTRTDWF